MNGSTTFDRYRDCLRLAAILLCCLVAIGFGLFAGSALMAGGGGVGLCYLLGLALQAYRARRAGPRRWAEARDPRPQQAAGVPQRVGLAPRPTPQERQPVDPNNTDGLIGQMLAQSRHALLLRPQIAGTLTEEHFRRTIEALRQSAALVPEGDVVLRDGGEIDEDGNAQGRMVHVEPFFLDRFPVTNGQYYEFVAAGGYREMALWDRSVWPAVLDMVDQTGQPGPRFWTDGCYAPGEEDLPVVGVCWYEAAACARWLGKRLPTDAEWVKAACWPVAVSPGAVVERRYPWGDTMDRSRANLWGSGPGRPVAVGEFAEGVSVGGAYQLIGNVWEWTSGSFRDHLKSIRGGAFDTYFDHQASAQFQSGETPLGRHRNIGFRCAVGMCDLVLARPVQEQDQRPDSAEEPAEGPGAICQGPSGECCLSSAPEPGEIAAAELQEVPA